MDAATIAMRPVELFYIYGSDVGVGAYGPPLVADLVVWSGGSLNLEGPKASSYNKAKGPLGFS